MQEERSESEVLEMLETPVAAPAPVTAPAPVDDVPEGWLAATGQARYLRLMPRLTLAGMVLAAAGWITRAPGLHLPVALPAFLTGLGALLVCGSILLVLLAVRCHRCGCAVALHCLRTAGFTSWLRTLQETPECPRCGHRPGTGAR